MHSTLTKKIPQWQHVLRKLEQEEGNWVEGIYWSHESYPRILQYHTRIHELEHEHGLLGRIEGRWSNRGKFKEYRLKPKDTLF